MINVTTHLYPEDLYGNKPTNDIVGEVIALTPPSSPNDYYFTIPAAAPFYKNSVKVWNYNTNEVLVEGVDYVIGHIFIEPLEKIGQYIAGSIRLLRMDITAIIVNYHTLGAPWGFSSTAIERELELVAINPLVRSWGQIDPLPYSFPPAPHTNTVADLVGSSDIKKSLDDIVDTLIRFGQGIPDNHINDFNNPHRTKPIHLNLENLDNFKTATLEEALEGNATDLFATVFEIRRMIDKYSGDVIFSDRINAEEAARNDLAMSPLTTFQQTLVTIIYPITDAFSAAAKEIEEDL